MLSYPDIALEVAGPAALFTRPDTGSTPISYPVPTYSAAKGMFEAVTWRSSVYIKPTRVEICKPIRYERYITNYGGPLRKRDENNYQLIATILVDVCYKIYAIVKQKKRGGQKDHAKELWGRFNERLVNGQTYYTPCLGWKEFAPSYFGQVRTETMRDESLNLDIPSLLHSMWDHRQLRPTFKQDWWIVEGKMSYEKQRPDDVK